MIGAPQADFRDFLVGGGEMGALVRAHDWSSTAVGSLENWPQSLRSAVSILLPSRAQICLFWGPDFVAIYNDAYRPTLGIKHPWALGRPAREVWSEIWDDLLHPIFRQIVQTGEAFWSNDHPFLLERLGFPEETYYDVSYDPVRDESGRVGGVFCIVSETTGRVLGERRLRTLRDVSHVASEAQGTAEAFRRVAEVLAENPQDLPFALLYDQPGDSDSIRCVATSGAEARPPEHWPLAGAATRRELVLEGDALAACGPLPAGPWPEPIRSVMVLPIRGSGQTTLGFLVAGISPRRPLDEGYRDFLRLVAAHTAAAVGAARALAEERARAQALAELDRAKTLFFSNISHEFRTPLTLMLGPVEDVLNDRDHDLAEPHRENLDRAHRNALRLLRLVNMLLDFSRMESGRIQAAYAPVDLAVLTAELASVFRSAIERASLEFIVDCAPLPEPIYIDREMWEKIVLNLLSNALKFTFTGTIAVRLRWTGDAAELIVSDTGTGVAPEHLPHLFERFYRVPNARSRTHEGSGIGLALVDQLVRLHGGEISVDSESGRGTSFTVRLPAGTAHLPADRITAEKSMAPTAIRPEAYAEEALLWLPTEHSANDDAVQQQELLPASERLTERILWVDDNADMREYVRRILSPYWIVDAVADGAAALARLDTVRPDLVLADVMMPRIDGFELLRQLRTDPKNATIPVILLSARAGEEARIEGLQAGADDYLIKPFSARELIARIRTHLAMSRLRREYAEKQAQRDAWFNVAVKAARLGVWFADPITGEVGGDANLMWILERSEDGVRIPAEEWQNLIHPDDRPSVVAAFHNCATGFGPLDVAFRIVLPSGAIRWISGHGDLVPAGNGTPARIVGVAQDITEQRSLLDRQQLLLNELNHRVKNTLATVLSLAKLTAAGSTYVQDFFPAFEGRILALSAAHALLTRRNWETVSLREIVRETLAPHRVDGAVRIDGPDLDLRPAHALALSLGLHELATNACKYGALTTTGGQVEVLWNAARHNGGHAVRLTWAERGGPVVVPPARQGFGTRLIRRALAADLDGEVQLDFAPAGVRCTIDFNLEHRTGREHAHLS